MPRTKWKEFGVLNRLKTTAFDISKELRNKINDTAYSFIKKHSGSICPHGTLDSKEVFCFLSTDYKSGLPFDIFPVASLHFEFDYPNRKTIRINITRENSGVIKSVLHVDAKNSGFIDEKEFDEYDDFFKDCSYVIEKGLNFAKSDFDYIEEEVKKLLKDEIEK